jgi:alkanesulfonate monooxygenase SsuD/methylene tetrahydromethanopterin reductase-like flavin-dependent oxidoreductase (luciferase family)
MCAVTTICGESDDEAQRLAAPMRVAVVNTRTGKSAPIVSIEDALARKFTPEEQAICDSFLEGAILGGPSLVAERLPALARELDADELMLSTLVPGLEARRASLERIAAALA